MNDIIQTWWPILVTIVSLVALAVALWVNSQIDKKCGALNVDKKISTASEGLKEKIGGIEKSLDCKIETSCDALQAEIGRVEKEASLKLDSALGKLYGLINDLGNRTMRIETRLDGLPAAEAVHEIALQCRDLIGEMKRISAEVKGTRDTMTAEMESVRESSKANQATLQRLEGHMLRMEGSSSRR